MLLRAPSDDTSAAWRATLVAWLEHRRGKVVEAAWRVADGAGDRGEVFDLIDAVYAALAIEALAVRSLRRAGGVDVAEHAAARLNVRLAVLRLTVADDARTRRRATGAILAAFGDRAARLAAAFRAHAIAAPAERPTRTTAQLAG